MEYRNELKFQVSDADLMKIKYRLQPLMQYDSHQGDSGYVIRSLYFDDVYDSCMTENENGISMRDKYRIRIYNGDTGLIRLEKKSKYRQMTRKVSQILTKETCDALLSHDMDFLSEIRREDTDSLLRELAIQVLRKNLAPKCIVEYDRFAFIERIGNVRITFDRNISGCRQTDCFYDQSLNVVPIMPQGHHILEVKYDELLPQYLLSAIDLGTLRRQSFSKYYFTRTAVG